MLPYHFSGTQRQVRRTIYPPGSAPAAGVLWQWSGDAPNQWNSYDLEVANLLEDANTKNLQSVDLSQTPSKFPYIINLRMMSQTRHGSGYVRNVRRIHAPGSGRYTPAPAGAAPTVTLPSATAVQTSSATSSSSSGTQSSVIKSGKVWIVRIY